MAIENVYDETNENYVEKCKIDFGNNVIVYYDREKMQNLELAYSITIHKSQGSEWDTVIIPMLTSHYIMLQRNLIYTAVTRAKKQVVLVGQGKALGMAISKVESRKRNTQLASKLKGFDNNHDA